LQNDCYGVSTESGSDRVTILAISILTLSGDPVASTTPRGLPAWGPRSALGTDLILKLRQHPNLGFVASKQ